ncbi:MAG: hypothetical protein LBT37_04140 [Lactobacillaceae bacterium]|jgi:hypothetical protein|nr:hypothetical protein [Lactobacillaceae bacterium]
MATRTFNVFGETKTFDRTLKLYKGLLETEKKLDEANKEYSATLESEEFDEMSSIDFELKMYGIRIDYLALLFDKPVGEFDEFDPKDIVDFYQAFYLWVSTRGEQTEETDDPSLALESMKRFDK